MSLMATTVFLILRKKTETCKTLRAKYVKKNLGNILYIWLCMVKSKYLNSENQNNYQHLIEDDEMSLMVGFDYLIYVLKSMNDITPNTSIREVKLK